MFFSFEQKKKDIIIGYIFYFSTLDALNISRFIISSIKKIYNNKRNDNK